MPYTGDQHQNGNITLEHQCVPMVTTTDATVTTVFSYPISTNKHVSILVEFLYNKGDYTSAGSGSIEAGFIRASGNVSQTGSLIVNTLTSFTIMIPSVTVSANTSTQSVDVKVTGLASTTVNWYVDINIRYNT